MIACDVCNEWYHGRCVRITAVEARKIKTYVCPPCTQKTGQQIVYKTSKKKQATKQSPTTKQEQNDNIRDENFENKKRIRDPEVEPVKGKRRRKNSKREGDKVRCLCDDETDEGLMIQCEVCQCWLHCDCLSMQEDEIPENYTCPFCQKEAANISNDKLEFANLLCDISSSVEKKNIMDKPNIARWKESRLESKVKYIFSN